jgi:NAD+ synthase (glutamine-hydrolysing)
VRQDITLQNIQARTRMVVAYMMSQIIPEFQENGEGFIMVLGSANLDE